MGDTKNVTTHDNQIKLTLSTVAQHVYLSQDILLFSLYIVNSRVFPFILAVCTYVDSISWVAGFLSDGNASFPPGSQVHRGLEDRIKRRADDSAGCESARLGVRR